jgi:hypothetical protein
MSPLFVQTVRLNASLSKYDFKFFPGICCSSSVSHEIMLILGFHWEHFACNKCTKVSIRFGASTEITPRHYSRKLRLLCEVSNAWKKANHGNNAAHFGHHFDNFST